MNVITRLVKDGILEQMGVQAGDALIEINGKEIKDVFDYRFLSAEEYVEVLIEKKDGDQWLLEIEKDIDEDLGAEFAEPMMDAPTHCQNRCVFCFIDQLPQGMRKTLYFKDDDTRLSFLQGNYVTLTNLSDRELDRIIYYRLSPINVSVHTTDADLRVKMTGNKNASKIMERLQKISEAGIELNCQIVLVKGMNDGERLRKTIGDLMEIEGVRSVSAVPVGITRHRENLARLEPFTQADAKEALSIIGSGQRQALRAKGSRFIYGADELYLKADIPFPKYEEYDGFPQLENGVGMIALFEEEFTQRLQQLAGDTEQRMVSVVTGKLAAGFIRKLSKKLSEKFTKTEIQVIMVENTFFGEEITVSGLITGADILRSLREQKATGRVLLPSNCFKADADIFLDDMSLERLSRELEIEAVKVANSGAAFIDAIVDLEDTEF